MRNSQESADFRARKILVKKLFKNLKKNYWYLFILQRGKSWGGDMISIDQLLPT